MFATLVAFVMASAQLEPIVVRGAALSDALQRVTELTGQKFRVTGEFAETPVTLILRGPDYVKNLEQACELAEWRWSPGQVVTIRDEDPSAATHRQAKYLDDHRLANPKIEFVPPIQPDDYAQQLRRELLLLGSSNERDDLQRIRNSLNRLYEFSPQKQIAKVQTLLVPSFLAGRDFVRVPIFLGDWPVPSASPLPPLPNALWESLRNYCTQIEAAFEKYDVRSVVPTNTYEFTGWMTLLAEPSFESWNITRALIAERFGWPCIRYSRAGFRDDQYVRIYDKVLKLDIPGDKQRRTKLSFDLAKADQAAGLPYQTWISGRLFESLASDSQRTILVDWRGLNLLTLPYTVLSPSFTDHRRLEKVLFDSNMDSHSAGSVVAYRSILPLLRDDGAIPRSVSDELLGNHGQTPRQRFLKMLSLSKSLSNDRQWSNLRNLECILQGTEETQAEFEFAAAHAAAHQEGIEELLMRVFREDGDPIVIMSKELDVLGDRLLQATPVSFALNDPASFVRGTQLYLGRDGAFLWIRLTVRGKFVSGYRGRFEDIPACKCG